MPCSRHKSDTGTPPSAWRKMLMISASLNLDFFIQNLLYHLGEKILLVQTPNFREDYHLASSFNIQDRLRKAKQFREYLLNQWNTSNLHPTYLDFSALIQQHDRTFTEVEKSLERERLRQKSVNRTQNPSR
jgi:hypothetical protein